MDRSKIVALLKAQGLTVDDKATDEQLLEQLTNAVKKPAIAVATTATPSNILDLKAEIDTLKAANAEAKRVRISAEIDKLVSNDQLPGAQREKAIARAMADESYLVELSAMPSKPPGAAPVATTHTEENASPADLMRKFASFDAAMKSWQAGNNSITPEVLAQNSAAKATFFRNNQTRMHEVLNVGSNTIPAGLQRSAILQEVIYDFARRIIPLKAFATVFSNVPLEGTSKVQVPYYDLDATASTSWVTATGYAATDTVTAVREIQIGNNGGNAALLCDRKYQGLSFTSEELARYPYLKVLNLARLKADKLASDIIAHVLSVVTAANYGAAAITKNAALFDSNDIADLKAAVKEWPLAGRSLLLDSAYDAALMKDSAFKSAANFGGSEAIRRGVIPEVMGFDYYETPTIPDNSENLVGMAVFQSAILFAQAPVPPAQAVRNAGTTYEIVTDPVSGISFEYRTFGDNTLDAEKHFVEASYGFAVGNGDAIKRIVSA